jgi:hypothetical protein
MTRYISLLLYHRPNFFQAGTVLATGYLLINRTTCFLGAHSQGSDSTWVSSLGICYGSAPEGGVKKNILTQRKNWEGRTWIYLIMTQQNTCCVVSGHHL